MTRALTFQLQNRLASSQEGLLELNDFPTGAAKSRYAADFVNVDRRSLSNTVFRIDDNTFTSVQPRASHWSIAWSDLMMTMFILFLSMFVYQTAHQDFLAKKTPEVIGGDTTEALRTTAASGAAFPFAPIHPGLPLMTAGTVKKVDQVQIETFDPETVYPADPIQQPTIKENLEKDAPAPDITRPPARQSTTMTDEPDQTASAGETMSVTPSPTNTHSESQSLRLEAQEPASVDRFQEIYTMSQGALKSNNLDKFAAIDIVPDKTMRIILTGDLLFAVGESDLSENAKASLQQIVEVVRHTPYMINVVGHTDNLPMRSNRFKSNWELSVARASSVARFFIDEMDMNPNQFVVSGYSSYRPIVPNTTAENRAKNRRVEIIISKRLPTPLPATEQNLK